MHGFVNLFAAGILGQATGMNEEELTALMAEEHQPDVVVMDIAMPNLNGIEATRRIVASHPQTGVVILSMHQDESYVLQSLKAGARGYLLKDSPREDVLDAIRSVAKGRAFLTRKISRMLQEAGVDLDLAGSASDAKASQQAKPAAKQPAHETGRGSAPETAPR